MHLYDAEIHVGTATPVVLQRDGTTVLFQNFTPTDYVLRNNLALRKLALMEVTAYVAEHVSTVRTIRFALSGRVKGLDDGMKLASARSALLRSIGVLRIKVTPNPDSAYAGQFVVEGLWTNSPQNLAMLRAVLDEEREAYGARKAAANSKPWRKLVAMIMKFLAPGEEGNSKNQVW